MEVNAISSYRLAKEIGVHQTSIKNWRNGTRPLIEHLKKVSDFFGVSVEDLISDEHIQKSETGNNTLLKEAQTHTCQN